MDAPPLVIADPLTRELARRLWDVIDDIEAAGHLRAVPHATLAWSILVGEAQDFMAAAS